ncbi:MAG TPA: hypothetical protein VHE34_21260 [Puia sp.]|uniref:hypothetical protein n=1 Tax=Puia sp. TaxID=2045100 RepID=UPI002CACF0AF|nr:hypothetical protein [Puia sp.]HVU97773.1 hypothetical protein [Puia sp.]
MIERIIENWLTNSSERSFQLPFCYLLIQDGYTIIHLTRHCGMEWGKDVIAIDPEGVPTGFQLKDVKGGRYKLRDWQQDINQFYQAIYTPLTHPSLPLHDRHRSVFVLNGDMDEEAFNAIHVQNEQWRKQNLHYKIEVIVKGQFLDMAFRNKDHFVPTELADFKALLEFRIDSGDQFLDKKKFSDLLTAIIHKEDITKQGQRRALSSGALLCALALTNYSEKKNHWAVIEGWTIYQTQLLGYCESTGTSLASCKEELRLTEEIITNSLIDLCEEIKGHQYLYVGNLNQDAFVYKYRVTILMGLMAYLGIRKYLSADLIDVQLEDIDEILARHAGDMIIWGEASISFYLCVYWYRKVRGASADGDKLLIQVVDNILGLILTPSLAFPDLYYDAEDTILLRLIVSPEQMNGFLNRRSAYTLETVIHLAALDNMREALTQRWNPISKVQVEYFEMTNKQDFYKWRIPNGQHVTKQLKETQSWAALVLQAQQVDEQKLPDTWLANAAFIPLLLLVYPHRFKREVILWFNAHLQQQLSREPYHRLAQS